MYRLKLIPYDNVVITKKSKVTQIFNNKIKLSKKKVQRSRNNPTNNFFISKALQKEQLTDNYIQ